jgi:hypothetical protein
MRRGRKAVNRSPQFTLPGWSNAVSQRPFSLILALCPFGGEG